MQKFGANFIVTEEDLKALVNGKFQVRKCTECFGAGWYWVHEDGNKRDPKPDENEDDFYRHACEFDENACGELGFHIKFDHED